MLLNRVICRIYKAAYFSYSNGSLSYSQWERFAETICTTKRRSDQLGLSTITILTTEFREPMSRKIVASDHRCPRPGIVS